MKNKKIVIAAAAVTAGLALGGCAQEARAVGTAVPPPDTVTTTSMGGMQTANIGERVELRPGVFATVTTRTRSLVPGGTGAKVPHVEVTVTYENHTTQPMQHMGLFDAIPGVADLNGQVFALSFGGDSHMIANLFPGHTGTAVETLAGPPGWDGPQPIQISLSRPALVGEPPPSPFDVAAVFVGVPGPKVS